MLSSRFVQRARIAQAYFARRSASTTPYGPSRAGTEETSSIQTKAMALGAVVFGGAALGLAAQPPAGKPVSN